MRKSIKKDEYQSKAELYQGISTELEYILNNQQSFFKKINSLKSEIKKNEYQSKAELYQEISTEYNESKNKLRGLNLKNELEEIKKQLDEVFENQRSLEEEFKGIKRLINDKFNSEKIEQMIKPARDIEEQIFYLSKEYCSEEAQREIKNNKRTSKLGKSIEIEDKEHVKTYIEINSYAKVITPMKSLIATGYKKEQNKKWHEYCKKTKWNEIEKNHKIILDLENKVLNSVLSFEIILKNTLTETIKKILHNDKIEFDAFFKDIIFENPGKDKKTLEKSFTKTREKMKNESGFDRALNDVWWYCINYTNPSPLMELFKSKYKDKTLYEMNIYYLESVLQKASAENIKYWCVLGDRNKLRSIHNKLNNFRIIRNSLCHNTPILTYLDQPLKKKETMIGIDEIKKQDKLYRDRTKILRVMVDYHNSLKVDSKINYNPIRGIILNYRDLRLKRKSNFFVIEL